MLVITYCLFACLPWLTRSAENASCEDNVNDASQDRNKEITDLLNSLLRGYKKYVRPGIDGPPVTVEVNILIRSMGPFSEEEMMFSMDCYFRQEWSDPRLGFKPIGDLNILRPSTQMLDDIWKPDTFLLNGHESYLHTITHSNKLFRISHSGHILYSQRLTLKSSCPMKLNKYPLDSQTCPLYIGSFGYTPQDVTYAWKPNMEPGPVKTYKDITMAQFTLTEIVAGNATTGGKHGGRQVLSVEIGLKREIGYYLLQVYLPIYLIVIISWISFWINQEATPARVMLGITTLLTTCTIVITGREGIPKVSYSTALDIFLVLCFSFVFAALVEYAAVDFIAQNKKTETNMESDEEIDVNRPLLREGVQSKGQGRTSKKNDSYTNTNRRTYKQTRTKTKQFWRTMLTRCVHSNCTLWFRNDNFAERNVSRIDMLARIFFPFSFICLNILYWVGFIYYF